MDGPGKLKTEDELLFAYDTLAAEIHDLKQKIQRHVDDLKTLEGQVERAYQGEKSHQDNLKTLVKSPVVSIVAYKDARAGLRNFRMLQASLSDKREKLTKAHKHMKVELPRLQSQHKEIGRKLDELERHEEQKVVRVNFDDQPGSTTPGGD